MSTTYYNNVAVFCGSRFGNEAQYKNEAHILGAGLAARKSNLIYGGGDAGLMGEFARSAEGAQITAVIPRAFIKPAGLMHAHHTTIEVENLFQRKSEMVFRADAAITLPGGIGTFDEVFEVLAFNDLNRYMNPEAAIKPLIIINTDGHFEGIVDLFECAVDRGFMDDKVKKTIHWAYDANMALEIYDELRTKAPLPVSTLL